jgi:hypothetical protein
MSFTSQKGVQKLRFLNNSNRPVCSVFYRISTGFKTAPLAEAGLFW